MQKLAVVLILGVDLISTNASILEHLYNNTHLRGNVKVDTEKGIKLGYDGSLSYSNGLFEFDIAKARANFNAVARPGYKLGNTTSGAVDYSGSVTIDAGHNRTADIYANGTAGLYAEYDVEHSDNGSSLDYNATLTNQGQWQVSAGKKWAGGTAGGLLNVTGRACKEGDKAYVHKRIYGGHGVSGNFSDGNETRTFRVTKFVRGGLKKKIYINHDHSAGPLPSVAYKGIAGGSKAEYIRVDGHRIAKSEEAGAKFSGLIWADAGENNDTYFHNAKHYKTADFVHKGYTILDHELQALEKGAGTVSGINSVHLTASKDHTNFTAAVFKSGDLHHAGVVVPHPELEDLEKVDKEFQALKKRQQEEFEGKEFEDVDPAPMFVGGDDGGKGIKAFVHAKWAGAKFAKAQVNNDSSVDVDTHGGKIWEATGVDSKHRKPWHRHGGFGYNASFEIDPHRSALNNVQIKLNQDPKQMEELKKRFQGIDIIAH